MSEQVRVVSRFPDTEGVSCQRAIEDSLASRRAADQLAEVICPDHPYFGRLGQVMGFTLTRAVTVNFRDETMPIPPGCYKILEKERLFEEEIDVVDSDETVGKLSGWRRRLGSSGAMGVYIARFGNHKWKKEDWLMMQEPTWQLWRREVRIQRSITRDENPTR